MSVTEKIYIMLTPVNTKLTKKPRHITNILYLFVYLTY